MTKFNDPNGLGFEYVVNLLKEHGIPVWFSSEGGEGTPHPFPIIFIHPASEYLDEQEIQLAEILSSHGYFGYYIKQIHAYQREPVPWQNDTHNGLEIEFWPVSVIVGDDDNLSPYGNM